MTSRTIVVDLDGTLIRSDMLLESANQLIGRSPAAIVQLARWLTGGRASLKEHLARATDIDPSLLPYHEPLLNWLRTEKEQGARLVLATASNELLASRIAAHLGIFDDVLASNATINLKAARKREALVEKFGARGFVYVGNDTPDLAVWQGASGAVVVSDSARLITQAGQVTEVLATFASGRPPLLRSLIKAMRPHQWMKNLLVFVPLLAAHQYGNTSLLMLAMLAFLAFGLTASSVYLLNDLVDVMDDRHHARKRKRPFASGDLSLLVGWLAWPGLLLLAILISVLLLPGRFTAVLSGYFLLTLAYSFSLKRQAVLDVITLAALYTVRIVAGAMAVSVSLSFWLLSFSMFLFLSLAFVKRFGELEKARTKGKPGDIRGRGYSPDDLAVVSSMGIASGYMSVLVMALYIQDSKTAMLYHEPKFIWLACPLLLYWVSRVWMITHRGHMHDDPIVFAIKDKTSWLIGAGFLTVFALARFA